jgi:iron complex transport system substrate-binding protein
VDARPVAAPHRGRPSIPHHRLAPFGLLLALVLAACGATGSGPSSPVPAAASPSAPATAAATAAPTATPSPVAQFPLTLTDDEGTGVQIPAAPDQIVSLTPAATETLFALGLGDHVVGKVEDFSLYPPEAANVPDVAKFGSVDVEKIVSLGTDLVIAGGSNFNPPESIQKLRSLGVPTIVVFAPDVKTALADIGLIGQATGTADKAAGITADIQASFDEVAAATSGLAKPRVFYELDATNGFFGPAPDYFGTGMIETAGGEPLTSGKDGVYQIEPERIVAFDPEIILLGDAAYGVTSEQVAARPGWDTLTAVKEGAIRPIDDVIVTRPGPRLGEGIRTLALAIHPDLQLPGASASPAGSAAGGSASPVASASATP